MARLTARRCFLICNAQLEPVVDFVLVKQEFNKLFREKLRRAAYNETLSRVNKLVFIKRGSLAVFALLLLGCQSLDHDQSAEVIQQPMELVRTMGSSVASHQLTYLLQSPSGIKPDAGWPLLLFLHGYGECGNDIQNVKKHGPPKLISRFDSLKRCVVISPQCPRDSWWRVDALRALIEEIIAERGDIDRDRLYVTGLSMGGYGIWSFISRYPNYFAAAAPICGGGDPFRLPANRPPEKAGIVNEFDSDGLKSATDLPIWTFHGTDDNSVPILETEMLVDLLKDGGNQSVKFTAYQEVGHVGAWEKAYDDPSLWDWLFAQ